jgi:Flp pilus assembly protein TadD
MRRPGKKPVAAGMGPAITLGMPNRAPPAIVAALCVAIVAFYAAICLGRPSELGAVRPSDAYYNLLVDGLRTGQLSIAREPPPGLVALTDPYDSEANADYRGFVFTSPDRVHDLSYFEGRLYLYFGITPALLLFLPYTLATGGHLGHGAAILLFASAGFLLAARLLVSIWREHFPDAGRAPLAASIAVVGLGSGLPIVMNRTDVWEVPVYCGLALVFLALNGIWEALRGGPHRFRWMLIAGLASGLALGARPSLLGCVLMLLVPAGAAIRTGASRRETFRLAAAALVPVAVIGMGLLLYNQLRFGSAFEFGQQYQLAGDRQDRSHFSLAYLWFNFRAYFIAPAGWELAYPFVRDIELPELPAGYGSIESPFGVLVNMPFTLLALALPFAAPRKLLPGMVRTLAIAAAVHLVPTALLLCLFYGLSNRYQLEMTPLLVLLAGVALLAFSSGGPRRQRVVSVGLVLAVLTVGFNLLAAAKYRGEQNASYGMALLADGRASEAVPVLQSALRLRHSQTAARVELSLALALTGRDAEATAQLAEALDRDPSSADGVYQRYAPAFLQLNREEDVDRILRATLDLHPDNAGLHNDRGAVLARLGRSPEAVLEFEEALRLEPENPDALANLAVLAMRAGRIAEARSLLERALRSAPDHAGARQLLQNLPPAGNAR